MALEPIVLMIPADLFQGLSALGDINANVTAALRTGTPGSRPAQSANERFITATILLPPDVVSLANARGGPGYVLASIENYVKGK